MSEKNKITIDQSELAFKFLKLLFSDDTQGLWDTISKVDQARIYGMYRAYISQEGSEKISFLSYIRDIIKPDIEKMYIGLKENPGIATIQRYTEEGEALIYLLKNIQTSITYISPTPEKVFPIAMTIDANLKDSELKFEWKIRIYHDQDYKYLK